MGAIYNSEEIMFSKAELNTFNIYTYKKDRNSRYIDCNERFAEICGLDSPAQIIGKSDIDLPWKEQAKTFYNEDEIVRQGNNITNRRIPLATKNTIIPLLNSKQLLVDTTSNDPIILGFAISLVEGMINKNMQASHFKRKIALLDNFGKIDLSVRELEVLKQILRGSSAKQSAKALKLSYRTVEYYIENLKSLFNCNSKQELIEKCFEIGFIHLLI
jgi:DNA-binding CsgD family transcriptional regulator